MNAVGNEHYLAIQSSYPHNGRTPSPSTDASRDGWGQFLFAHYPDVYAHSRRVSDLSVKLAQRMGLNQVFVTHMRWGGLLHDIGKLRISSAIVNKPGSLTETERKEVERHPVYGHHMLLSLPFVRKFTGWTSILEITQFHHERWDGKGYPYGLRGTDIPLSARICSVADVWDALRSDRPYRKAWSQQRVMTYIDSCAGSHFDPQIVQIFLRLVEEGL